MTEEIWNCFSYILACTMSTVSFVQQFTTQTFSTQTFSNLITKKLKTERNLFLTFSFWKAIQLVSRTGVASCLPTVHKASMELDRLTITVLCTLGMHLCDEYTSKFCLLKHDFSKQNSRLKCLNTFFLAHVSIFPTMLGIFVQSPVFISLLFFSPNSIYYHVTALLTINFLFIEKLSIS